MVNLKNLRKTAVAALEGCNCDSPLADVDYILMHLLNFEKKDIILGDKIIDEKQRSVFDNALLRLKSGEPVQYIVGGCEFMSLWFQVNAATLIPRADTEILVESIINMDKNRDSLNIFEIGTGSGCIAISLAHYLPKAKVISADISVKALETAAKNAERLGVGDRCTFIECDIMKEFPVFDVLPDVIVSNPPYIPHNDIAGLENKVKRHEPLSALDGGCDGLDFYRRIARDASITEEGILAFEVGIGQAQAVRQIMSGRFTDIEIQRDIAGIERVVTGKLKKDAN